MERYPYWVNVVRDLDGNDSPMQAKKGMFGLIIRAWVGDPTYVFRGCLWVHRAQIEPLVLRKDQHDDRTWCDRIAENQEKLLRYLTVESI